MDYKIAYSLIDGLVASGATEEEIQKLTNIPTEILTLVRKNQTQVETTEPIQKDSSVLQFIKTIDVPALSGKQLMTIDKATDVFYYIDSDFQNWGLSKVSQKKTEKIQTKLSGLAEDAPFKKMFVGDLSQLCMTQSQIVSYCKENRGDFSRTGPTFFLQKANMAISSS